MCVERLVSFIFCILLAYPQPWENGQESSPGLKAPGDRAIMMDLNFDGWDDLCYRGWDVGGVNIPYYCMLWNHQTRKFEFNAVLYNVETDPEKQWISCKVREGAGEYRTTYYRYDQENCLHMVKYVEENQTEDAVFAYLELTYVEDGGMFTLPALVQGEDSALTIISMAKQALSELYQWTGNKVSAACFNVSDAGGVVFAMSPEDIEHSRIFFSRYFGTDTEYNLSGYDKSISSIGIYSGRAAWYSPVLWNDLPSGIDTMPEEEVIRWYFERMPAEDDKRKIKKIERRYQDIWTIQAQSGEWFEVIYNAALREISDVTGPYPSYPVH